MEIVVGQIWEVTTDSFATTGEKDKKLGRRVLLHKGEKIEIRYAYEWHFRTEDNHYFHATPETIKNNARLYGVIWENVRFGNSAKLDDILRLRLYDKRGQR